MRISDWSSDVCSSDLIDGMVHLSDISWDRPGEEAIQDFKKGDMVQVKVLDVDVEKERISLGMKQLVDDPFEKSAGNIKRGDVVTRSEERRVGKECGRTCRSRRSPSH